MRALDLFCKAGGASKGLQRAGFHVVGVDIEPQPRYCGDEFIQADVIMFLDTSAANGFKGLAHYDLIWASPPCQAHTSLKVMHNARPHLDLIPAVRERLIASGLPYVIENVVGAPLDSPVQLCGTHFGLGAEVYDGWRQLRRHRLFEASFPITPLNCAHQGATIGIYGDHARDRRRKPGVRDKGIDFPDCDRLALAHKALDTPWMNWKECSQAIPPAYSEYIGREFLKAQEKAA